jgi:5-methylcytosine-specific restriction protein A
MPSAPKRHGYEQRRQAVRLYDRERGNSAERGYDARWRKYRLWFLQQHPLCVDCLKQGKTVAATVVDHIVPHRGDETLFWATDNHQSMCESHHAAKTRRGE